MRKVVDYKILDTDSPVELEKLVRNLVKEGAGFEPQGGVNVCCGTYTQAMVKYEENNFRQELKTAILIANKVLDRPYYNIHEDIAVLARQLLRQIEK